MKGLTGYSVTGLSRRFSSAGARSLALLLGALTLLAGAASANAATWNAAVSLPSAPTGYSVQIGQDPNGGPTLMANNLQDNQISYTDLTAGPPASWSDWARLGPNGGPYAQPWPPNYQLPWGDYLPVSFSVGANGDMVAAWIECTDIQGNNAEGCVLKASLRPSGADWDTPVTVDDGTTAAPGTGSSQYPATSLVNPNSGSVTQLWTAIDGSGNATIMWGKYNSGSGEDFVTGGLLSDGTTLTPVSSLGYVTTPLMAAAANGDVTYVYPSFDQTYGQYLAAISAAPADIQNGSLPSPQVAASQTYTPLGLTTDSLGHATLLALDSSSNMVTANQDSGGNWQAPLTVAPSPNQFSPTAELVEDAGGDASVVWADANNVLQLSNLPSAASSWSAPHAISDSSHPYKGSGGMPVINSAGDMVVAWGSTDSSSNAVVYARVRPAGGSFDAAQQLGPAGAYLGATPVISDSGVATVLYSTVSSEVSQSTDPVGSGGGGGTLSALGQNPGAPALKACRSAATMPKLTGLDQGVAVPKLEDPPVAGLGFPFAHVTVIERHPTNPPSTISKDGFGDVYSQTPAAGAKINPCIASARLVVYGGPSGVSAADYKSLKGLVGQSLSDALNLGSTWHIDWHFRPDSTLTSPKVTKVAEISLRAKRIGVDVAMPTDKNDYQGRLFHGGTFTSTTLPSIGADGDLSMNMRNVFAESVWSDAVPESAQLIMDTHDVGNNETRGSGFAEDNIVDSSSSASTATSNGEVRYLKDAAVFHVTPLKTGDVYLVASWPCGDFTCYAFDDIPVTNRDAGSSPKPWDSYNGYRYAPNGDYCGKVQQQASSCSGPARDGSQTSRRLLAADSCPWYTLWCLFGALRPQDRTPAPGTNPAPIAASKYTPLTCSEGSKLGEVNGFPITCGPLLKGLESRPVYDFGLRMYPMFYSQATGLTAGHVYRYVDGKALDLLDGSSHDIIAAGSGNVQDQIHLQPNEVFGVYGIIAAGSGNIVAAGSGNIIAAGSGNVTVNLHWPVLDGDSYKLDAGMWQINRPDGPDGNVVATPVKYDSSGNIVAAGSGNIIAAGSGNIIAAGSGNLANGYYNIIAAGSGNIIAAGSGNIIAAGSGNVLDYNSIMTMLPTAQDAAHAVGALANGPTMTGQDNAHLYGGAALSSNSLLIPSLANPGQGLTAGGSLIDLSKAGSLGQIDLQKIIAAGSGNIIAAGSGNIIAAGSGNLASKGVS